ncbi:MAG: hypothetical protein WDN69_35770 [Aliidongia sp.]
MSRSSRIATPKPKRPRRSADPAGSWPASLPRPLVSSFAYPALETAYRVAPELARGLLLGRVGSDWRGLAEAVDAKTINCDHARLTETRAKEIRAAGYPLLAYTVNHARARAGAVRLGASPRFSAMRRTRWRAQYDEDAARPVAVR